MKTIFVQALERVPAFSERLSFFQGKLQIAQFAKTSVTNYSHALCKAVIHIGRLPDDFTQKDVDEYLKSLLRREPVPAVSQFKHFIYGLKCYRKVMGCTELRGLELPRIRREKKLPRILSVESVLLLLSTDDLYSKTLLAVIYECGLRASEACSLTWPDVDFYRRQVHIRQGKGRKDRIVPIASNMLKVLDAYRGKYPSRDHIFKSFGKPGPIRPAFIRRLLREALRRAGLDESLTIHSLRHSHATHLLELGEDIQSVQRRLGHRNVTTTMGYLHVAKIEARDCLCLLDVIVPPKKKSADGEAGTAEV